MTKPFPITCVQCVHSVPRRDREWLLYCTNPIINSNDAYFLGAARVLGTSCIEERGKYSPFAKCGIKGKLWEPKQ